MQTLSSFGILLLVYFKGLKEAIGDLALSQEDLRTEKPFNITQIIVLEAWICIIPLIINIFTTGFIPYKYLGTY